MNDLDLRIQDQVLTETKSQSSQKSASENRPSLDDFVLFSAGDNRPRWVPGERLHHLFEQRCDEFDRAGDDAHLAIDSEQGIMTYRELDRAANRLARYMAAKDLGAGDIIGLLFDRSIECYVALLAVQKINAAYVPFDVSFPKDRIDYITKDAGVSLTLTLERFAEKLNDLDTPLLCLDQCADEIDSQDDARLTVEEIGEPLSELSYIIYTSGTTGRPKGVPIQQSSICNFVRVAKEVYDYRASDRIYQGLTIAFDYSVEEIWVPLIVGNAIYPSNRITPPPERLLKWQAICDRFG